VVAAGIFVGLLAVAVWLAFPGTGRSGSSGGIKKAPLYRLAASSWTAGPFQASAGPAVTFYDRTLPVKSTAYKALYVTVTGTAHQTNGDILALTCELNGGACDSYGTVRVANTGANAWVDNSFTQTWCVTPSGSEQHLELSELAAGLPTNTVYIEHVNVIVDASSTTDACSTEGFVTN
jgi:hypothetical protein